MRSANHAAALAKERSCRVHSYHLRFCVFTVSEVGPIHSLGHACLFGPIHSHGHACLLGPTHSLGHACLLGPTHSLGHACLLGPTHSLGHACLLDRLCRSLGSDNELELPAGSSSLAAAVTTGLAELEDEMFANLSRAACADT
jgi:hypothetical protein